MKIRWINVTLLLAGLGVLAAACSESPSSPGNDGPCNLLLITLDTTRADRLGCYGHDRAQTPALDRLAAEGVRFEQAFTNVPLTLPAHATIFTGLLPPEHGLRVNGRNALGDEITTLTERFHEAGHQTGAFVAALVLDARFGLKQGFETYDQDLTGSAHTPNPLVRYRPGDRVADAAIEWLEARADKPFFCWVHFFDPHLPLNPPPRYRDRLADPYDGEVAFMDAQVKRLVDFLDEKGARDRTLVVAVGDHGEGLGDHGEKNHGFFLYDSTMQVPLIFSQPGILPEGKALNAASSLADLYPTLLELCGLPVKAEGMGRSLAPLVRGLKMQGDPLPCYGETLDPLADYGWSPLFSLTTGEWKYILAPEEELYHRTSDPGEQKNQTAERPEIAARMKASLQALRSRMEPRETADSVFSAEERSRLQGLGYGSGRLPENLAELPAGLRDPKQMLETKLALYRGEGLIEQGRLREAEQILRQVVLDSPETATAHEALGLAHARQGEYHEAINAYGEALALDPTLAKAHLNLGCALSLIQRTDEAIAEIRKAIELEPTLGEAYKNLGVIYEQTGRLDEAEETYREALRIDPDLTETRMNLAIVLAGRQRLDEAIEQFQEVTEREPAFVEAWLNLGVALRMEGRLDEAINAFEQALKIQPGFLPARQRLQSTLQEKQAKDSRN